MAKRTRAKTKKYTVEVKELWCHTIEVELPAGSTWQQIIDAARKKVAEGDEGSTEYSHTFVPETWNVRDEQGNDV